MHWLKEKCMLFLQMMCIKIVKLLGVRIPKHVAIIMDGNRRFARRSGLKLSDGHSKGYDKLSEVLQWCADIGVKELTVYAFSIENFKRSEEEVTALVELLCKKLQLLLDTLRDKLNADEASIRMVGRWSLLSDEVRALFSRAMMATRGNNNLKLNIAWAYTGRDEISRAASVIVDAVKNKELLTEDVDEDLVSQTLELGDPDLLLRTSGEVRLSDFMMWQVSRTVIYFTKVMWPEFSFFRFMGALLHFHIYAPAGKEIRKSNERKNTFLGTLEKRRWHKIENCLKYSDQNPKET